MQRATNPSKIHHKNILLQRAATQSGLFGQKHTALIDKLAGEIETQNREMEQLAKQCAVGPTEKEKELMKRIESCQRE
jgi:hypothetical protein